MRFVNTSTLRLEKVADFDIQDISKYPKGYAILSHRWGQEGSEIDFEDLSGFDNDELRDNARLEWITAKAGWPKFEGACNLARRSGFDLIWIDTCCIDKRDSVELGEAINSMYRWYSEAAICFVYLEDVGIPGGKIFEQSAWFDRGWTLQELIAPGTVWFYDNLWRYIGSKTREISIIQGRTGIPATVLLHRKPPNSCSIAQRMSWAASRQTTRIEDAAYSLMGLFDVNIPMMYGERERAFVRLQEEIIKKNGDLSIFAWEMELMNPILNKVPGHSCGMFAPSPAGFKNAGQVVTLAPLDSFGIGQRGLSIKLKCRLYGMEMYLADLASNTKSFRSVGILLAPTEHHGQFTRIRNSKGDSIIQTEYRDGDQGYFTKEFHIRQEGGMTPIKTFPGFWLAHLKPFAMYDCDFQILSHASSTKNDRVSIGSKWTGTAGIIKCEPRGDPERDGRAYIKWMRFGFDREFNPVCLLLYQYPGVTANVLVNVNEKLFLKVMHGLDDKDGRDRSRLFDDSWLNATYEEQMSFSLLRGDRNNGLREVLGWPVDLSVKITRERNRFSDSCTDGFRNLTRGDIWAISIECHNDVLLDRKKRDPKSARAPGFWKTIFRAGKER